LPWIRGAWARRSEESRLRAIAKIERRFREYEEDMADIPSFIGRMAFRSTWVIACLVVFGILSMAVETDFHTMMILLDRHPDAPKSSTFDAVMMLVPAKLPAGSEALSSLNSSHVVGQMLAMMIFILQSYLLYLEGSPKRYRKQVEKSVEKLRRRL
jgi:hypothetical protein